MQWTERSLLALFLHLGERCWSSQYRNLPPVLAVTCNFIDSTGK